MNLECQVESAQLNKFWVTKVETSQYYYPLVFFVDLELFSVQRQSVVDRLLVSLIILENA